MDSMARFQNSKSKKFLQKKKSSHRSTSHCESQDCILSKSTIIMPRYEGWKIRLFG